MWLQNDEVRIHIPTYLNLPNGKLYKDIENMKNDKINDMLNKRYSDMAN
jgi:hypothetical protein